MESLRIRVTREQNFFLFQSQSSKFIGKKFCHRYNVELDDYRITVISMRNWNSNKQIHRVDGHANSSPSLSLSGSNRRPRFSLEQIVKNCDRLGLNQMAIFIRQHLDRTIFSPIIDQITGSSQSYTLTSLASIPFESRSIDQTEKLSSFIYLADWFILDHWKFNGSTVCLNRGIPIACLRYVWVCCVCVCVCVKCARFAFDIGFVLVSFWCSN